MSSEQVNLEVLDVAPQKHINEAKRFGLLVIGSYACVCTSFSYAFNLISTQMQKKYHLSQRDLTTITTVGLVFQYVCLPYAFLFDYFGPLIISILATIYLTIGSVTMALCFRGAITGTIVRLSVFNAIMLSGCALFDLSSCVTVPSYFPTRKGAVIALLKTFTGLGQAIVGSIYTAFFVDHEDNHLFFLMACAVTAGILSIIFMRLPSYHLTNYELSHLSEEQKKKRESSKAQYLRQIPPAACFIYGFIIIVILIVFLPVESTVVTYLDLKSKYKIAFAIVVIVVTLAFIGVVFPIALLSELLKKLERTSPSDELPQSNNHDKQRIAVSTNVNIDNDNEHSNSADSVEVVNSKVPVAAQDNEPVSIDVNFNDCNNELPETVVDYIAPQYQGTFLHNLLTPELWCIWWSLLCLVGTEFVIIFNASFVYAALNGAPPDSSMRALLTVFNGVGSAVGRLIMSYFEYWSNSRPPERRIPITVVLFIPACTVTITIILFLTVPPSVLPLPFVLGALGNGFLAATTVLVMRIVYAKDPAKHYNFLFIASTISLIAFNRFLYGEWYTKQAEKQGNANQQCYGKKCVLMPFCFLLGLCCTSVLTSAFAHIRYSRFCRIVLREREHLREEARQGMLEQQESNIDNINESDYKNTYIKHE